MKANRVLGFTLIELMIVVAIMAVLVAIAYPAYQRYGFRARRADGKDFIMAIASAEERYFTNFNSYTTTLSTLGLTATSPYGYYSADIANNSLDPASCSVSTTTSTTSYVVTVTPVAGGRQAADACGALMYDSLGTRCPLGSNAAANSNGACW